MFEILFLSITLITFFTFIYLREKQSFNQSLKLSNGIPTKTKNINEWAELEKYKNKPFIVDGEIYFLDDFENVNFKNNFLSIKNTKSKETKYISFQSEMISLDNGKKTLEWGFYLSKPKCCLGKKIKIEAILENKI